MGDRALRTDRRPWAVCSVPGRIKVYSVDSISGRSWLRGDDPRHSMWLQNRFDDAVRSEVVPAIRTDCRSDDIEILAAGASIGAFWALEVLCRHPDVFRAAIGMSGTYDLSRWRHGHWSDDHYFSSPIDFLPGLEGDVLRPTANRGLRFWRRGAEHGRTREKPGGWRACSGRRASPIVSTSGRIGTSTTGRHGTRCCRSTWTTSPELALSAVNRQGSPIGVTQ